MQSLRPAASSKRDHSSTAEQAFASAVFVDLVAGEVSTFISSHRWLAQLLLLDVGIKRYVRQFPPKSMRGSAVAAGAMPVAK